MPYIWITKPLKYYTTHTDLSSAVPDVVPCTDGGTRPGSRPLVPPEPAGGREVGLPKDAWSHSSCSGENGDGVAIDFGARETDKELGSQATKHTAEVRKTQGEVGNQRENTGRGIAATVS